MPMIKKDRDQVAAIIEDELNSHMSGGPYRVKRIWWSRDMVMASYEREADVAVREAVRLFGGRTSRRRQVGYDLGFILEQKKERFGSGSIAYK